MAAMSPPSEDPPVIPVHCQDPPMPIHVSDPPPLPAFVEVFEQMQAELNGLDALCADVGSNVLLLCGDVKLTLERTEFLTHVQ